MSKLLTGGTAVGIAMTFLAVGMSYYSGRPKILWFGCVGVCFLLILGTNKLIRLEESKQVKAQVSPLTPTIPTQNSPPPTVITHGDNSPIIIGNDNSVNSPPTIQKKKVKQ